MNESEVKNVLIIYGNNRIQGSSARDFIEADIPISNSIVAKYPGYQDWVVDSTWNAKGDTLEVIFEPYYKYNYLTTYRILYDGSTIIHIKN